MAKITGSIARDSLKQTVIAGGAAGNLTVTGIKVGHRLVSVLNLTDGTDLTSEFSVSATNTINNTGGTSSATKKVLVTYIAVSE
jgi:hypothetical protein